VSIHCLVGNLDLDIQLSKTRIETDIGVDGKKSPLVANYDSRLGLFASQTPEIDSTEQETTVAKRDSSWLSSDIAQLARSVYILL